MNDATLFHLRQQLVARYEEIKRQLTLRLGSDDLAREVLQETYVHLGRAAQIGPVRVSASVRMLRNLNILNGRPPCPTRSCR